MNMRVLTAVLALAVLISAVAVVHTRHRHRSLFVTLQALEQERDALDVHWGQLQLEESTWGSHNRIERVARKRLGLVAPRPEDMVVIRDE